MDPKKPKTEDESAAAKRVESLISGKPEEPAPEPGQASQRLQEKRRSEASGKPVLTEKQRIEARRRRQAKKRRPVTGNVLSRGLKATGFEIRRTMIFLGRGFLSGIDALKPAIEFLRDGIRNLTGRIGRGIVLLVGSAGRLFAGAGKVFLGLDRVVTTRRALTVIAIAAAGLLVASQFLDFRAIEIGQPGYAQVEAITRAPRTEVKTPIDTHSFLLVAVGLAALAAALLSGFSRKRVLGLVIAAAGGVTLAVALAIDLPAGLDAADAELSYAGVKAILLSGFWLEVGSGVVLLVSGFALILDPARRTVRTKRRRTAEHPSMVGGPA